VVQGQLKKVFECVASSTTTCGFGTVPEGDECVVDPTLINDLQDIIDQLQTDIQSLLDILSSGEITICHNGDKTKTISLAAFGTHVGHGDTIGECP